MLGLDILWLYLLILLFTYLLSLDWMTIMSLQLVMVLITWCRILRFSQVLSCLLLCGLWWLSFWWLVFFAGEQTHCQITHDDVPGSSTVVLSYGEMLGAASVPLLDLGKPRRLQHTRMLLSPNLHVSLLCCLFLLVVQNPHFFVFVGTCCPLILYF